MIWKPFSDLFEFQRDPLAFIEYKGRDGARPFEPLHLSMSPSYLVTDPMVANDLLRGRLGTVEKGALVEKMRPAVGNSTLILNGVEHQRRRKALHALFDRRKMLDAVPLLSGTIRRTAGALAQQNEFVCRDVCPRLALDMAATILLGEDSLTSADEQLLITAVNMLEDDIYQSFTEFGLLASLPGSARRRQRRVAQTMIDTVVSGVRSRAEDSATIRTLKELGLSNHEIRDEIATLLLAGHHTTGSAAAWLLYFIATIPELADALAREAASLADELGEIDPAKLHRATVSQACVRETLRLYTPAWFISRETTEPIRVAGTSLRKGTTLWFSSWYFHRSPEFWEAPEEFNLQRKFHPKAYFPFGAGPRACVGLSLGMFELQLIALEFASTYRLELKKDGTSMRPIPKIALLPPPFKLNLSIKPSVGVQKHEELVA